MALGLLLVLLAPMVHADETTADEGAALAFTPEAGIPGTMLWVSGTEFSADARVQFGGVTVEHQTDADGRLGFTVPDFPAQTYEIRVLDGEAEYATCCFLLTEEKASNPPSENEADPDADADVDVPIEQDCRKSGLNVQCSPFGSIQMASQQNIRGDPVSSQITVQLDENYADQGARYVLFSVRNVTDFQESPVVIALDRFGTAAGEIITMRVDHDDQNELNIWVNVLDLPVGVPITLDLRVGSTDRGAYLLEALVMPFDRGYEPIKDDKGQDISLYAYTLLGVNDETGSSFADKGGGPLTRIATPGFGVLLALGALLLVAIAFRGRRA